MAVAIGGAGLASPAYIRVLPYSDIAAEVKAGKPIRFGSVTALSIKFSGKTPMVYKRGRPGQVVNEYIAYQLYRALGLQVPHTILVVNVEAGGIPMAILIETLGDGVTLADLVKYGVPVPGGKGRLPLKIDDLNRLKTALREEFIYHALLMNWDAINWEDYIIIPTGDASRIDLSNHFVVNPAGAMFYRASGEPKLHSDLHMADIHEFTRMPVMSKETPGKLYSDLIDVTKLRSEVCDKAKSINRKAVFKVVKEMRPLFGFLPRGSDLLGLMTTRFNLLQDFCARRSRRLATDNLAGLRYDAKAKSLAEGATTHLRARGRRNVVVPEELKAGDLTEHLHVYDNITTKSRQGLVGAKNGDIATDDSEKHGIYLKSHITLSLDRTVNAERVRRAILASREDPVMVAWLREQVAFIKGLSKREYNILATYTMHGDILVNNYLRGTLGPDVTDLILESLEIPWDNPNRTVPLAYSIYDQYPELTRVGRLNLTKIKGAELQAGLLTADGELNMDLIREIIEKNIAYFGRAANLGPLIEQYRRDLVSILERAPKARQAFTVFRGIRSEAHLGSMDFQNVDFLSTSLSVEDTVYRYTEIVKDETATVKQPHRCCIYELEVQPGVPCIYMQFVSEWPEEFEILIAPGMMVSLEPTVRLKMMIPRQHNSLSLEDVKRMFQPESTEHTKVAVVEGSVRPPIRRPASAVPAAPLEEGSFEGMVAGSERRGRFAEEEERFAEVKPRSMVVGRNRTRHRSATARRRTRRLHTIRSGSDDSE